jgi:hypothetical protein
MKQIIVLNIVVVLLVNNLFAQGCSDAGFCSIPYHQQKITKGNQSLGNSITTDITFGLGDGNTTLLTPSILYSRKFGNRLSWDTKVTASYITGSLGSIFNVGDWYSTINYALPQQGKKEINFLAGVKIPMTSANDKIKGQPLPMPYQTSLGTYDLLLGTAWVLDQKIDINVAFQIPVINSNKNTFIKEYATDTRFETTNNFIRKPDALFRLGYILNSGNKKWLFRPNVLAIYHLGEDSYENIFGQRQNLNGSKGLTLNLNLQTQYKLSTTRGIGLSIASPLIVREIRPDGLTRSLTVGLNYFIGF